MALPVNFWGSSDSVESHFIRINELWRKLEIIENGVIFDWKTKIGNAPLKRVVGFHLDRIMEISPEMNSTIYSDSRTSNLNAIPQLELKLSTKTACRSAKTTDIRNAFKLKVPN